MIGDWDTRFRLANYTQEQRRFIRLSQDKLQEWFDVYRKTDWINQDNSDGVSTEYKRLMKFKFGLKTKFILSSKKEQIVASYYLI